MARDENLEVCQSRSQSPHSRKIRHKRILWSIVEASLFRYSFHSSYRWRSFLLTLFGAKIGRLVNVRRTCRVYFPWNLRIGDFSSIGDDTVIYNLGAVVIGDLVTISQEAYLCAGTHDYRRLDMLLLTPAVHVRNMAWICARAFVGPGVTVGEGAIVGAASVAMRDVPQWTIVAGNPATFVRERSRPA